VSAAYGSEAWEQFLDGCMRLGQATGGFILDHSGLAVALQCDLPGPIAESLGSRLVVAIGHLESETHLGTPDHPCISVRVPGGWLSTATVAGGELAIGLFSPSSLGADVWALIHDGASEMLALRRV
jgi:hypothetical protein